MINIIPDITAFLCVFAGGLANIPIATLQYVSIGTHLHNYSIGLLEACYAQVHKNSTCNNLDSSLQSGLSSLNMAINLCKLILATIFVYLMGGLSDVVGKKVPILVIVFCQFIWSVTFLVNTIYVTAFPPFAYIFQQGVLLSFCGGSQVAITTYVIAYLSSTTPQEKQPSRFGIMFGIALLGLAMGPLGGVLTVHFFKTTYYQLGITCCALQVVSLVLAVFCIKNVKDNENALPHRNCAMSLLLAIKRLLHNAVDVFKRNRYLKYLILCIIMYMVAVGSMAAPLITLTTVYTLGKPFNWSLQHRLFFASGITLV